MTTSPSLLAIDWGTTRLRAYLLDDAGSVLDRVGVDEGIMAVPPGGFPATLRRHVGPWLQRFPGIPVVLAGMVGSRNGWVEVPYLPCPTTVPAIGAALTAVDLGDGLQAHIVPGLSTRDAAGAPDVMRGEETKVAGCDVDDGLVVTPGTHAKWIRLRGGRIEGFATFMTGDFYGAFMEHTILGKLAEEPVDEAGFARGLAAVGAAGRPHPPGFLRPHSGADGRHAGRSGRPLSVRPPHRHGSPPRPCPRRERRRHHHRLRRRSRARLRAGPCLHRPLVPNRSAGGDVPAGLASPRRRAPQADARVRPDLPRKDAAMTHRQEFDAAFAACPVIAILRGLKPDEAVDVGEALVAAGIRVLEVPLNSPQPLDSIGRLAQALAGRAVVGAGTVYRVSDVEAVAEAGGTLIVSPNANAAVIGRTKELGLVSAPGVMTPSEAILALDAGADVLKLFPGEVITPAAIRAYAAVMPAGTRLVLVGGVSAANLRDYADTPLAGYGIGSALYKPGLSAAEVGDKARAFLKAYAESGARRA